MIKEYNIKHHYTTKHSSQFDKIVGQARVDKIERLKKSIKKQGVFTTYKKDEEMVTKLSFKLCECMAEKGKPFSDEEFIKKLFDNIHRICMPGEKKKKQKKKNIWLRKLAFPALLSYAGQMIF